jgi:hypothetical protein
MRVSRTALVLGAMLLAALVGGGTWALAHGGDPKLVHACVNDESGAVRVVGAKDQCSKKETALDWSIQGPAGPQGPQGEPGVLGFYTLDITPAVPAPAGTTVPPSPFVTRAMR